MIIFSNQQLDIAAQIKQDHSQVKEDEVADESQYDALERKVLPGIADEPTEANQHATDKVEAYLVHQMLIANDYVLPLGFKGDLNSHEQAGEKEQLNAKQCLSCMLAHCYNNERVEYAAKDESKWVHDR